VTLAAAAPPSTIGGAVVVTVVLASAVLHATWNALAHSARDRVATMTVMGAAFIACSLPVLLLIPAPARAARPFVAASILLETAYSYGLVLAYRYGEFSRTYPLARGTSPLLVTLFATLVLGQHASDGQLLGIGAVCAGLLVLSFAEGLPKRGDLAALCAAVGTGCTIAAYTIVDGLGVRRSGSVLGYAAWTFLGQGLGIVVIAALVRRRAFPRIFRADVRRSLTGGVVSMTAYGLVLWAQSRGSLAGVATLRETSILVGCVIGSVLFRERFGRTRLLASAGVVAGVLLIAYA
jgi:drug/metabolite transporter (DMT)-like permease